MANRHIRPNSPMRPLSRRQLLQAGGLLVSASAVAPHLLLQPARAAIASGSTFDFYISPSGSDSNAGTLSSPWAITAINSKQSLYAGKRLGLIAGTYDISSLMNPVYHTPVLNVNGGTTSASPTYIGSSDANGNESPRSAVLDAKGATGIYGGGNSNVSSMIGQGYETNVPPNKGNFTLSGLKLIGFSLWAIHIGNYDGGGGQPANVIVRDCEITGGSAQKSTAASGVNLGAIINYTSVNAIITNNYIHDNFGWSDAQHFSAMYIWGLGSGTHGIEISYNTLVNTGCLQQKEGVVYNSTVAYNYIDMTNKTPSGGNAMGMFGWNADNHLGTLTTIHHNIIIGTGAFIDTANETGQNGWYTPAAIFNNTFVLATNGTSGGGGFIAYEMAAGLRPITFYNNLYHDNGFTPGSYGYIMTPKDIFSLSDFNIYGTASNAFTYVPPGGQSSSGATTTSFANWKAQTGSDAHSSQLNTNPFTNNGAFAMQFQVESGSSAYQTGRIGGVLSGAPCNVGAWDGIIGQIGCNFTSGNVVPDAPSLTNVS